MFYPLNVRGNLNTMIPCDAHMLKCHVHAHEQLTLSWALTLTPHSKNIWTNSVLPLQDANINAVTPSCTEQQWRVRYMYSGSHYHTLCVCTIRRVFLGSYSRTAYIISCVNLSCASDCAYVSVASANTRLSTKGVAVKLVSCDCAEWSICCLSTHCSLYAAIKR